MEKVLHMRIPEELHRAIKVAAELRGKTMKGYVLGLVVEELARVNWEEAKEGLEGGIETWKGAHGVSSE